ncbi:MAG: VanZ family protein [Proteobacteria bacterium]|nr:VanZ family protein [Pseudomonadota bacterium]MDA0976011.1 VanZ family protein [Pseudomonadota bacterium]MDA1037187.1 VanZ family protein [Pseudomonadota bacterium]
MKTPYRTTFFLSLLIVFYLSIVPAAAIPKIAALDVLSDKLIHALIFLFLSFVGLKCHFNISKIFLLTTIFGFGLSIEVIHYYHPYRFFEIADLIANLIGILAALVIFNKKII